jgi:thiol-disulfide isomerase/thioredoxin
MKKFLLIFFTTLAPAFIDVAQSQTQQQYIVAADSSENNAKMLIGIINKNDLLSDTSFSKWYAESQRIYPHPDTVAVNAFKNNKDKIYFLFFGGTWCEDTHFILPKFYKVLEASGFPDDHVTVFMVDRKKNVTGNLAHAMNIKATPTIVVIRDGKETGRLVEYGKTGHWDSKLAAIIER